MRLLYQRYYLELKRGFTEEDFWALCAEVAGSPLTEVRRAVDTTDDIDYDYWLRDAGLRIDGYKIQRIDRPTKAQKAFLEAMQLLKK
jgi:predicted metalloprotease with PDZ domain